MNKYTNIHLINAFIYCPPSVWIAQTPRVHQNLKVSQIEALPQSLINKWCPPSTYKTAEKRLPAFTLTQTGIWHLLKRPQHIKIHLWGEILLALHKLKDGRGKQKNKQKTEILPGPSSIWDIEVSNRIGTYLLTPMHLSASAHCTSETMSHGPLWKGDWKKSLVVTTPICEIEFILTLYNANLMRGQFVETDSKSWALENLLWSTLFVFQGQYLLYRASFYTILINAFV